MDNMFNQDELSADDLAVLRAFDELDMTGWEVGTSEAAQPSLADILSSEDLLLVFVGEAEEDMSTIRQALQQLEPDEHLDAAHLQIMQHIAHKMKGTCGAIGYMAMSTLAHYIEVLTGLIIHGTLAPFIGLNALIQTVDGLEKTLSGIVSSGQESTMPLTEVESEYKVLNIDMQAATHSTFALLTQEKEHAASERITRPLPELPSAVPSARIDLHRFDHLVRHTEQLTELRAPLENAQAEVGKAMQELHIAQARLRRLETTLSSHFLSQLSDSLPQSAGQMGVSQSASSLVVRILNEAIERTGHSYQRKSKLQPVQPSTSNASNAPFLWDELEIDRFTERDVLLQSLSEAIADVATASARLQAAFAQLNRVTKKYMEQAVNVRKDALLLRWSSSSQGTVRGLLVRVGSQRIVVPFSQVQRIEDSREERVEPLAILNALLNFPMDVASTTSVRPVLILQSAAKVEVDEVLGEGEFVVKPLSSHLQRPGVAGTAIDGMGNVLLILDVPVLVRRQHLLQPVMRTKAVADQSDQRKTSHEAAQPMVLVADDSVYIRQSVLRTLRRAGYEVTAVQDGMEALEHLLDHPPDVLVLDVEMPNLNGFDVLNIMRTHTELAHVKVIMLTSRSSEKHRRRAYELGAHAYLIKPCPRDMLLETLRVLLEDKG